MVKVLKRLFGKKQQPRRYQVPEGLADRVAQLMDYSMRGGFSTPGETTTNRELWLLIEQRCPETKEGDWGIRRIGARFYVEELPA